MSSDEEVHARLEFALHAADAAAGIILKHFAPGGGGTRFQTKPDGTPVTVADVGAEELVRELIGREWPGDGVLGEECGHSQGSSEFRWVIDPIDGTKSYVHGVPLFGTLIGVQRATDESQESSGGQWQSVAGVAAFPALSECVYGALGAGAWHVDRDRTRRPARVSAVSRLRDATVSVTSPRAMLEPDARAFYLKLNESVKLSRGWSDCYGSMLVATGRIEAMIEPPIKLWDIAALEPIILEAGGRITGWDGLPTEGPTAAVISNGLVHDEIVALLQSHHAA